MGKKKIIILSLVSVIVLLAGTVEKALKDYTDQKKEGKEPEFKAQSIGITTELDFWS